MPSLKEATQPVDTSKMTLISSPSAPSFPPISMDADPGFNSLALAPIPPVLGTDVDAQRQFYRNNVSQLRMPPLPAASKIAQGAQAASQIILEGGGNPAIELQVNNIDNPVQNKLNLTGEAVSYGPNPGQVQISGGGDDTIHGDANWYVDDAYASIRDDFFSVYYPSTASTGYLISDSGPWFYSLVAYPGTGGSRFISGAGAAPYLGGITLYNDGNSNDGSTLIKGIPFSSLSAGGGAASSYGWPLFDVPSWKMVWNFSIGRYAEFQGTGGNPTAVTFSWTKVSFYCGLANTPDFWPPINITVPVRPEAFVGLRYDTDLTSPAIGDTQFVFEAVYNDATAGQTRANLNPQGNTFATGITATEGAHYRFEMVCTAINTVTMSLYKEDSSGILTSASQTISVPVFTTGLDSHLSLSWANGVGVWTATNAANATFVPPLGFGSPFTIAGTSTQFDGSWIVGGMNVRSINFLMPGTSANSVYTGTVSGNLAVLPYFAFGNDSQSSPTASSKAVTLDFMSFIWNPGIGGGTGTPNPNKPRYW